MMLALALSSGCVVVKKSDDGESPGCQADRECDDDEICVDGSCQSPEPPAGRCSTDDDCEWDELCIGTECLPFNDPCNEDYHCTNRQICGADGICIPKGRCRHDVDCESGESCDAQGYCTVETCDPCTE